MAPGKSKSGSTRKKSSSSKTTRGSKQRLKNVPADLEHRQRTFRQITGIAVIAAGVLLAIFLMIPAKSGSIGMYISQVMSLLCGDAAWVVPPLMVYYGVAMLFELPNFMRSGRQVFIGIFLLVFTMAAVMHLRYSEAEMWMQAMAGNGGGLAGAIYAYAASFLFGKAAIPVFIVCTLLISFVLLGGNSLTKKLVLIISQINEISAEKNKAKKQALKKPIEKKAEEKSIKQTVLDVEKQLHDKISEANKHQVFDINEIRELGKHEKQEPKKGLLGFAVKEVPDTAAVPVEEKGEESNVEVLQPVFNAVVEDSMFNEKTDAEEENETAAVQSAAHKSAGLSLVKPSEQKASESDDFTPTDNAGAFYVKPNINLLNPVEKKAAQKNANDSQIRLIEDTFTSFGVQSKVIYVADGPSVTRYEIQIAPGIKVSKILGLSDDLALSLASADIRIEAPIPGKSAIGIEVPKKKVQAVVIREVLDSAAFNDAVSPLTIALGKDVAGDAIVADLAAMPHLLVAGSTGSGKSVCINSMICSILYKADPEQVKLLMIDPKMVELNVYNGIPHLMAPVVTEAKKASGALKWVVREMENRYKLFAGAGSRDLRGYNELQRVEGEQPLPQIVVIIDELADLMMVSPADVEDSICRLAQMARAAGIHLVVATQRPSVDVITGLIKANIPSRISFAVSSQIDSRTILDMAGAEKLLGRGDMLFMPVGASKPHRVQGVFISEQEIERVVNHVKNQQPVETSSIDFAVAVETEQASNLDDELFGEAGKLVIQAGQASVSLVQRRLRVGYARAARLIDMLEQEGVIGPYEGSKPREVLLDMEAFTQRYE